MNSMSRVSKIAPLSAALALVFLQGAVFAAPPKVVTTPNSDPGCFAPWSAIPSYSSTRKKGPYRVALANGYIANTWRIRE